MFFKSERTVCWKTEFIKSFLQRKYDISQSMNTFKKKKKYKYQFAIV